jgi:hypothetical protein
MKPRPGVVVGSRFEDRLVRGKWGKLQILRTVSGEVWRAARRREQRRAAGRYAW